MEEGESIHPLSLAREGGEPPASRVGGGKVQAFPFSPKGGKGGEPAANRDRGQDSDVVDSKKLSVLLKRYMTR
jgi:hypothetical protein